MTNEYHQKKNYQEANAMIKLGIDIGNYNTKSSEGMLSASG